MLRTFYKEFVGTGLFPQILKTEGTAKRSLYLFGPNKMKMEEGEKKKNVILFFIHENAVQVLLVDI